MTILFILIVSCNERQLQVILPHVVGEICLRLLQNSQETKIIWKKPGYVWRWNAIREEFEQLEALKWNDTAFCSVDEINDMRGRTLVVATDFVSTRIFDQNLRFICRFSIKSIHDYRVRNCSNNISRKNIILDEPIYHHE